MSQSLVIATLSLAAAFLAARIILELPSRNWPGTALVVLIAAAISYSAATNRYLDNALIGAGVVLVFAVALFAHALLQRRKHLPRS